MSELFKFVENVLTSGATALAVIVLVGRTWLSEKIKHHVEDTYKVKEQQRQAAFDESLEKRKTELSKELEGWKAGYQKALDESRVRFSKLHEDRAKAIKGLYQRLVLAEDAIRAFVAPLKFAGQNEEDMARRLSRRLTSSLRASGATGFYSRRPTVS